MRATSLLRQLRHSVFRVTWTTSVPIAQIKPPRDIYVPMPKYVPVATLSPAPAAAPPAPAPAATPPPASVSKSPAPILPRVSRETKHKGYVEARYDAWRDPCNARRIAGIRPSPRSNNVDDGTCGFSVNAGDSRINQDRPSTQRPERIAGSAERAYTGSLHTKQCIRIRGVASCRLTTLNASGVVIWWISKLTSVCFVCFKY